MKSLKKFFALCLTLALALSLAACAQKPAETTDPAETPDTPAQETEAPVTARIAALKGPTAMGLVKLMSDAPSSANGPLYDFTLAGSADEVTPALIKGELDMACVPANLAAVLYNKTEGAVQVLAVNTLGVLYIVENGESVQPSPTSRARPSWPRARAAHPSTPCAIFSAKTASTPTPT